MSIRKETESVSPTRLEFLLPFLAAFGVALLFAIYTNHTWEDWYITYRASKNLAAGNGLVFSVGERVHSFTSPLGTLIPAFFAFVSGNRSDDLVLWLYRLAGCSLLGVSSAMLLRIARSLGMSLFSTAIMIGLFVFDARIVDFSINGQETAFMMLFLVLSLDALLVPSRYHKVKLGISWGGLMWTRPDAFIYFGALAIGFLVFKPSSPNHENRLDIIKSYFVAFVVLVILYLPWILWTWSYYGTPIPHTIIAKGLFKVNTLSFYAYKLVTFPVHSIMESSSIVATFMPPYYLFTGWPPAMILAGKIIGLIATYYWCLPFGKRPGRAASFSLFLSHYYLTVVVGGSPPWFFAPWYVPNVTFISIFVVGQILEHLSVFVNRIDLHAKKTAKAIFFSVSVAILVSSIAQTAFLSYQSRCTQDILEDRHRKKIGLWLKENADTPNDTVFLECLGYIGFYSQLKMLDWPGLSSPEVVEARRSLATDDFAPLIRKLHPDWLVLRPAEVLAVQERMPDLLTLNYRPAKVFDVTGLIESKPFLPDRQGFMNDKIFTVYRKVGKRTGFTGLPPT